MSSEERARILRMVADGKISPVEAEDLLAALEIPKVEARPSGALAASGEQAVHDLVTLRRPPIRRNLVIEIHSGGDNKVNLRIPLGLARAAGRFLPRQAILSLANYDINLDQVIEGVSGAHESGTLLEVHEGDERVRIAVE